jgi:hypothetical protein
MFRFSLLLLVSAFASSCYTTQVGDFTILANENLQIRTTTVKRNLRGEHCKVLWSQGNQPSIERAVDRIHDQVDSGTALQNVSVEYYLAPLYYGLIGRACFRVEADVVEVE